MRPFLAVSLLLLSTISDRTASSQASGVTPAGGVPVPAQSAANTLLDGTPVKLRLAENLSSATAKTGQSFPFEVIEEIDLQGIPVIAKGAPALATVTMAETKKSMGRAGKLDINVDSVRLIDGEKAALSATRSEKGGGHTGAMTAGIVATSIVFFPAAPLLLFIHGKDITIPKGTEITAFISGDMKLETAKFEPAASSVPAPAVAQTSSVTVESSVPNCDIEIDGQFVGSTPSTLTLNPGKHTVVVKKAGYTDWTRSMEIVAGSVRLNADMAIN